MPAKHLSFLTLLLSIHPHPQAQMTTVQLRDVDSGLTSPAGNYRWLNVADQAYSPWYQTNYNYTKAAVAVTIDTSSQPVRGVLVATNLKPDFAYQLKLAGTPGTAANERLALAGRYWQEEWNGTQWANGSNLNDKGTGYFPSPNDLTYLARREVVAPTSPTGRRYRYTGYLVLDYFVTDSEGNATQEFLIDSCYHVLWKTSQNGRGAQDGPLKTVVFDPSPARPAYGVDYPQATVSIFGEWERLPVGGLQLRPGDYSCQVILTEESFHGSGGTLAGGWAAAMGGDATFRVAPRIQMVAVAGDRLSLAITDCYVGFTNTLERLWQVGAIGTWQSVFTFVSVSPSTNWSDSIIAPSSASFYRVRSEALP